MNRLITAVMLSAITFITGCTEAGPSAPLSTPELRDTIGSGKKSTIVFFINPEGGPCRAQKEILQELHKDRGGSFNLAYVSTTRAEDQRAFYEYGVRNLPTVVLVDKEGKIINFFPPGIQNYKTLETALDKAR